MNETLFAQLKLSEPVRRAVDELGFENATEIQAQTIPALLEGRDVIGRSQTGTGKTLAFGIPAVELVDTNECKNQVQVLILCPTRELAVQACGEIRKLAKYKPGVKTADVYGGAPMSRQITLLRSGANVVVGTPGRIMDHLERRTLKLDHLRMVILDEADEMLSMGFREDIESILSHAPEQRQTVLFSATMPPAILALTKAFQKDPQLVEIDRKQPSVKSIRQSYYEVPMGRKMDALSLILHASDPQLCMIFCNTKRMVDELTQYLKGQGFKAEGLHGDMKQPQRTQVLNAFKSRAVRILVATDVAARGIDVDDIDYVINYDIPQSSEYYIHRIGRTGRAGKSGNAVTLCSGRRQAMEMGELARLTRSEIVREEVPSCADVNERLLLSQMERVETVIKNAQELPYMEMVENLMARGYTPEIIAAAALGMKFEKKKIHIDEIVAERRRPRSGMGRVSINIGRSSRVAPNHIVGALTQFTNLVGKDVGKIEIYDDNTVVGVPQENLDEVIDSMKDRKICGKVTVTTAYAGGEHSARPAGKGFSKQPPRGRFAQRRERRYK